MLHNDSKSKLSLHLTPPSSLSDSFSTVFIVVVVVKTVCPPFSAFTLLSNCVLLYLFGCLAILFSIQIQLIRSYVNAAGIWPSAINEFSFLAIYNPIVLNISTHISQGKS